MITLDLIRLGLIRLGLIRFGFTRLGYSLTKFGGFEYGLTRHSSSNSWRGSIVSIVD